MESSNKHIEDILNSLDGIERAAARPYMHTRIMVSLKEEDNFWGRTVLYLTRPMIAFACLLVVLFANIFIILNANYNGSQENANTVAASTITDVLQNDTYILAANDK